MQMLKPNRCIIVLLCCETDGSAVPRVPESACNTVTFLVGGALGFFKIPAPLQFEKLKS